MLNKIGNLFLSESRLNKFRSISNKIFLLGILVIIFFPLISKKLSIIEKFFMNTMQINYKQNIKEFQESYLEYMNAKEYEIKQNELYYITK